MYHIIFITKKFIYHKTYQIVNIYHLSKYLSFNTTFITKFIKLSTFRSTTTSSINSSLPPVAYTKVNKISKSQNLIYKSEQNLISEIKCISQAIREAIPDHFSCFFIKLIKGGLWQHEIVIEKVF